MKNIVVIFVFILSLLDFSYAGESSTVTISDIEKEAKFQSVPNNPVFDLIGISNNNIEPAGTISKVLASMTNAVDLNGKLQTGFAVSFSPYQLLKSNISAKEYTSNSSNFWDKVLTNSQVFFGTAPNLEKDSSLNWGVGLKVVFLNAGDVRNDTVAINKVKEIKDEKKLLLNQSKFLDQIILQTKNSALVSKMKSLSNNQNINEILNNEITQLQSEITQLQSDTTQLGLDISQLASDITQLGKVKDSVKESTSSWNTYGLDANIGIVYRSGSSQLTESGISKLRFWLNGGAKICDGLQFVSQLSYFKRFNLDEFKQIDSSNFRFSAMLRTGTEDFRFGIGANLNLVDFSKITKSGTMMVALELAASNKTWIVANLNYTMIEGLKTQIIPHIGFNTTGFSF